MDELKALIYSVFVLSFLCGIYRLLSVKQKETQRYLTFAVSLLSLALFCAPTLQKIDFTLPDFQYAPSGDTDQNNAWNQALLQETKQRLEAQCKQSVCEKFGIPDAQCRAELSLQMQGETVNCSSVRVTVTKNHAYLKKDIESYLARTFDCEITVFVWEESA
jgi:hypothetical protein